MGGGGKDLRLGRAGASVMRNKEALWHPLNPVHLQGSNWRVKFKQRAESQAVPVKVRPHPSLFGFSVSYKWPDQLSELSDIF